MKKVLLIDPWGVNNTEEYLNGLILGLNPIVDLKVFTNYYFNCKCRDVTVNKIFFKNTEKMRHCLFRKIFRGVEYLKGYLYIIKFLKKNGKVDVIHINWLLMYSLDIHFLKKLKKYTKKIVYTAHNVIPHINGEKSINKLNKIYKLTDVIILHGVCVKEEFVKYFPDCVNKIYIQKHGANIVTDTTYALNEVDKEIEDKLNKYDRICICFGGLFYNKGVDRVVNIWHKMSSESLLIVAGKRAEDYTELINAIQLYQGDNILFLDKYVDNNTLNFLISKSQLVILPYRHASMSGVVFTAADFKLPILSTNVGAISEYLINGENAFIVENDDEELEKALINIDEKYDDAVLKKMGQALYEYISKTCDWSFIVSEMVKACY